MSEPPGRTGATPDGHEHGVGFEHFLDVLRVRDGDLHPLVADFGFGRLVIREQGDALLGEGFFQGLRNLGVLDGQNVRQHFDKRDFRPERVKEIRELHADGAGPDDDHGLRLLRQRERFLRADDDVALEIEPRQRTRYAACGDEDVLRGVGLGLAVGQLHFHLARLVHRGIATDRVDLVFLEEEIDTGGALFGHDPRALEDGAPVVAQALDLEAEFRGAMFHGVKQLGVAEECLGGNAAVVVAGATGALFVHAGDFLAELSRLDGGDVAGRAGADDDEIVVGHKKSGMER
ncbi:MAG: hypothetical protein WDN28_27590 [Chthoniobacter sp.]